MILLIAVGIWSNFSGLHYPGIITVMLLFAMGMQNSFVTQLSDSVVRTTHLTGLFTDLGIDLSQLIFTKDPIKQFRIRTNIKLRFFIILFFFAGGIVGGVLFKWFDLKLNTLLLPALILIVSLFYDDFIYRKKEKFSFNKQNSIHP